MLSFGLCLAVAVPCNEPLAWYQQSVNAELNKRPLNAGAWRSASPGSCRTLSWAAPLLCLPRNLDGLVIQAERTLRYSYPQPPSARGRLGRGGKEASPALHSLRPRQGGLALRREDVARLAGLEAGGRAGHAQDL